MDPITVAAAATTTVNTVNKGIEAVGKISELVDKLEDLKDMRITSLTAYAKRTLITSRVYVEDQLSSEDLTPRLLKLLNSMYSGFVLTAIGLNNLIIGGRNIRQMTAPVATENYSSFKDIVNSGFGDALPSTESKKDDKEQKVVLNEKELKAESHKLFTGNLLEAHIPTGDGKTIVPLFFYVQLLPTVVPQLVMEEFLRANVSPSLSLRWAMVKAGEISFWKDFVFEVDRVNKRSKALRVDKEGILREIEDRRNKQMKKKLANLKNQEKSTRAHNICNSIIICTKRTMDTVCKDNGINLRSFTQRNELMEDLCAVMLCVIDTNYGTVDLYMNGIEGRGEYTAKTIEAATKSGGKEFDIKEILSVIAAGSMPRF